MNLYEIGLFYIFEVFLKVLVIIIMRFFWKCFRTKIYRYISTPGSPRFNEICDMLHENNVMFRDTDILPDNTYTHVNNDIQTCSWMDHIAMSDVLSESTVDCHTLQDVACSDHCAIVTNLKFHCVTSEISFRFVQKTLKTSDKYSLKSVFVDVLKLIRLVCRLS